MKFRKKPVVIDAVQFNASDDSSKWPEGVFRDGGSPTGFGIETLEGYHEVTDGDWIITGIKGEKYPCKSDIFEKTYDVVQDAVGFTPDYNIQKQFDFGTALDVLKEGRKVARAGWNGKGMWLCLGKGNSSLKAEAFWNEHTRDFAEKNGGSAEVLPYIIMRTADGKVLMGWLASQSDMLAEDWVIVA